MNIYNTPILGSGLYIEINIFAIIIMLMILYKTIFSGNNILHKIVFRNTLISSIIFSIFDIIRIKTPPETVQYDIIEILYFSLFSFTGYLFFLHFGLIIGNDKMKSSKTKILFVIPFIIIVSLYFFIKSYTARFIFSCLYSLLAIILLLRLTLYVTKENRYYIDRARFILYPIIPFIGGIVHILDNKVPMICGITIAEIIMYIDLVELLVTVDSLTQISNRSNLMMYMERKFKLNPDNLHVLMIDADNFKHINDTYGHLEGDKCLVRLSNVLKKSCSWLSNRAFLCRYGGDEFTVVIQCSDDDADKLKYCIYEELYNYNLKDNIEYNFDVTIGIAKYNENVHQSPKDLIDDADNNLYLNKEGKK